MWRGQEGVGIKAILDVVHRLAWCSIGGLEGEILDNWEVAMEFDHFSKLWPLHVP